MTPCRVKASEWFAKAAEQGHAVGLFLIGTCYEKGAGTSCYLPKAIGFYMLAACRGHRDAAVRAEALASRVPPAQQQVSRDFATDYAQENGFDWFVTRPSCA